MFQMFYFGMVMKGRAKVKGNQLNKYVYLAYGGVP